MAINFLYPTNTRPEIQINDTDDNPRLAFLESDVVSGGISTTGGNLVFETSSGVERARIDSVGRLMVNTTSPFANAAITVVGLSGTNVSAVVKSTDNQAWLSVQDDASGTYGALFGTDSDQGLAIILADSNATNRLVIDTSGKVGIGTDSPSGILHVKGSTDDTVVYIDTNNNALGDSAKISFNDRAQVGWIDAAVTLTDGGGNKDIKLKVATGSVFVQTNNTTRLTVADGGNVGIGTTTPTAPLDVFGVRAGRDWSIGNRATIRLDANGAGFPSDILFGHTAAANQTSWTGAYWSLSSRGSSDNNRFHFYRGSGNPAASSEAILMTFDPNLRVGINNTSPSSTLDVIGTGNFTGLVSGITPVNAANFVTKAYVDGSGGGTGGPFLPLDGGTMVGTTRHGDNVTSYWGTGDDLEIYHNSSGDSVIQNHVGDLYFTNKANNKDIIFRTDDGSGGFTPYFQLDGSHTQSIAWKNIHFVDGIKAQFGDYASPDLEIYHDPNHSYITNITGDLTIDSQGDDLILKAADDFIVYVAGTEIAIQADSDGRVALRYDNTVRFQTTSTGASVTGQLITTDDITISNTSPELYFSNTNAAKYSWMVAAQENVDQAFEITPSTTPGGSIFNAPALRIDGGTSNATFAGDIKQSTRIVLQDNGTIQWGATADYGNLTWDTGYALIYGQSGKGIKFGTNGSTLALELDTSQNATFAGNITMVQTSGNNTLTIDSSGGGNPVIYYKDTSRTWGQFISNGDMYFKDETSQINSLLLDGGTGNATFAGKAFGTTPQPADSDSMLATKGYVNQQISGGANYLGTWNPDNSLNNGYGNPSLQASGRTDDSGDYFICSADGGAHPNGGTCEPDTWHVGDWVVWNSEIEDCAGTGTGTWQKIDNTSVLSGIGTGQTVAMWEGLNTVTDSESLGNSPITVDSNNVNFADSISVVDSARFEGTTNPITIGDGFGYGGTATICKSNAPLFLQYNNGQTAADLNIGGGGTAVRISDYENNNYRFTSDSADSYVLSGGGDFGIGVTNPNATLHVKNDAAGVTARIQQGADGEESAIRFQTLDSTTARYSDIAQNATTGNLDIRAPYNATIPNLTIKNGGDVGINVGNPQAQLHISTNAPTPNTSAVTSLGVGLVVSGYDGLMDLLSYDDNTTVATSIGMGRYNQTSGAIIDKWGLVTWYDTGNQGSNLSERISLHYGTSKIPWNNTALVNVLRTGNVGIGNIPNAVNKLQVSGQARVVGSMMIGDSSTSNTTAGGQLHIKNTGEAAIRLEDSDNNNLGFDIKVNEGEGFAITESIGGQSGGDNDRLVIQETTGNVGIANVNPSYKLTVSGAIQAGGKTTYTKSAGSLDTTGYDVAGITALPAGNGFSCGFTFTCFGFINYQKIVYSCYNAGGTWYAKKLIDEGTDKLDVVASADGSTITFTYKTRSGTVSYTPKVTVEAIGTSINSTYA